METSKQQDTTIDALIATHRELTCVDTVNYDVYGFAKGGICLKIKSGESWYMYKILRSGAITEKMKSDDDIRYAALMYFTPD